MYKRLLVPLDGSELAEISLPYAKELAQHLGSEVILVNVRAPFENPEKPEHRVYISKMAAILEGDIKKSHTLPPGEKIKVKSVIIGRSNLLVHPAEEIVDYSEKENVSLIIMATHGKTGIKRWTLGSTANKVVRASQCPVMLIRATAGTSKNAYLGRILVPLDGSQQGEVVLPYIEQLASRFKSEIILLNVVESPYHTYPVYGPGSNYFDKPELVGIPSTKEKLKIYPVFDEKPSYYGDIGIVKVPYTEEEIKPMKKVAEKYLGSIMAKLIADGINTTFEVRVGSAGEEIIKAEKDRKINLVTMSTHGHTGFGRWDHGSIADKVLHAGNVPLLLVRPRHN